jgi:hypothetical protein
MPPSRLIICHAHDSLPFRHICAENWNRICSRAFKNPISTSAAKHAAEKVVYFVIPSEARNLSRVCAQGKKKRFLASLRMTKRSGDFFHSL